MLKKSFQETLIIMVHEVARCNHKAIRDEGLRRFFNKAQKINSKDKVGLHQWLQGVFFALYTYNSVPVDGTDIDQSVVTIGIYFPLPIELSPASSREGTS